MWMHGGEIKDGQGGMRGNPDEMLQRQMKMSQNLDLSPES